MPTALAARLKQRDVSYPVTGALLAAGAPLGLLVMRRFLRPEKTPLWQDLRHDPATYAYVAASTTAALTVLGWVVGRNADRLAELSTKDSLTGLLNLRAFHPRVENEIARSRRSSAPLTLLLLDLDRLKALNDRFGHAAGDRALVRVADAMRREMRSIDIGARLGGDEFALLAVGADHLAGRAVAERVRHAIAEPGSDLLHGPLSVSVGVITFHPTKHRLDGVGTLLRAADRALYAAKSAGRNRVEMGELPRIQSRPEAPR